MAIVLWSTSAPAPTTPTGPSATTIALGNTVDQKKADYADIRAALDDVNSAVICSEVIAAYGSLDTAIVEYSNASDHNSTLLNSFKNAMWDIHEELIEKCPPPTYTVPEPSLPDPTP